MMKPSLVKSLVREMKDVFGISSYLVLLPHPRSSHRKPTVKAGLVKYLSWRYTELMLVDSLLNIILK